MSNITIRTNRKDNLMKYPPKFWLTLLVAIILWSVAQAATSEKVTLWVPITWRYMPYTDGWAWIPDVPFPGVAFSAEIPSEFSYSLPRRRQTPDIQTETCRGDPAVKYCRIKVREEDVSLVIKAIPEEEVPQDDHLLIVALTVFRDKNGKVNNLAVKEKFEAIRDDVVNAPLEERQKIRRVLDYMVLVGLSTQTALEIETSLNLP